MKVSAINNNNYSQNNKSFKAVFEKNDDIKYFINESSYENMVRFRDLLARMKKKDDGLIYKLEKKTYVNEKTPDFLFDDPEDTVEITTGYELSRTKGNDPTTKEWVGGFDDDWYMTNKLGEVNDILEYLHPMRAGKITKGKMTAEIFDMMV